MSFLQVIYVFTGEQGGSFGSEQKKVLRFSEKVSNLRKFLRIISKNC